MEEWIGAVANIGFPMAVSVYLLTRIETKLSELAKSIAELAGSIEILSRTTGKEE